jgi:hypothetical protein
MSHAREIRGLFFKIQNSFLQDAWRQSGMSIGGEVFPHPKENNIEFRFEFYRDNAPDSMEGVRLAMTAFSAFLAGVGFMGTRIEEIDDKISMSVHIPDSAASVSLLKEALSKALNFKGFPVRPLASTAEFKEPSPT